MPLLGAISALFIPMPGDPNLASQAIGGITATPAKVSAAVKAAIGAGESRSGILIAAAPNSLLAVSQPPQLDDKPKQRCQPRRR